MNPLPLRTSIVCAVVFPAIALAQFDISVKQSPARRLTKLHACFSVDPSINQPEASLVVNGNTVGASPMNVLMGEFDPNVIDITGPPGAEYVLRTVSCGPSPLSAVVFPSGVLDDTGSARIMLEPGVFQTDEVFMLQAQVSDPSSKTGSRLTGATQVSVVTAMSSNVTLGMPLGSIADVRGPVTMLAANSVTIGNLEFQITPKTQFSNVTDLAGLVIGDWIVVDGEFNAAGGFNAKEIGREDFENQVRLAGRVQGLGPAGVVLLGVSVYVNSATTYYDLLTETWTNYEAIQPGMVIEVRTPTEALFPTATRILLNVPTEPEPEPEPEDEPEIEIESPPAPPFCS
jgi:Domain of unknown function (DUF5666)